MPNAGREVDRYLTMLRNKIRERDFTQLQVQAELGWGNSYLSQLLTKQKSLRVEQVLLVLQVIDVPPGEYFAELYPFAVPRQSAAAEVAVTAEDRRELEEVRAQLHGLVDALLGTGVIERHELDAAIAKEKSQ